MKFLIEMYALLLHSWTFVPHYHQYSVKTLGPWIPYSWEMKCGGKWHGPNPSRWGILAQAHHDGIASLKWYVLSWWSCKWIHHSEESCLGSGWNAKWEVRGTKRMPQIPSSSPARAQPQLLRRNERPSWVPVLDAHLGCPSWVPALHPVHKWPWRMSLPSLPGCSFRFPSTAPLFLLFILSNPPGGCHTLCAAPPPCE
jgi:hypothetical protein